MSKYGDKWGTEYGSLVNRNIGLITEDQQEQMRNSKVSVFGIGGVGGVVFEVLARCGIGNFSIIDNDVYEQTNMNRQIFAFQDTIGQRKIDVAEETAKKINPEIMIDKYYAMGEDNIEEILNNSDAAVLVIDKIKPCIIMSRKAREMGIPFVEGWALPYGNVITFTPQTPSLEEVYKLPTHGKPISSFTDAEYDLLTLKILLAFGKIEGAIDYFDDQTIKKVAEGHITSFAPIVWFTAVMIALETVKILLSWGEIALAPDFTLYDPFKHRIPKILDGIPSDRVESLSRILNPRIFEK